MELSNCWAADFETTPYTQYLIDKKTRVWLFYLENLVTHENNLGINLDDFFKFLFKKDEKQYIWFHNLSFDGDFIVHWLVNNKFKYVKNKDINDVNNKYFTLFKDSLNIIYNIKIYYYDHIIELRCSYKLIPMGIDKIAESTKQKRKSEFKYDYEKFHYEKNIEEVDKNELEYIINDVKVQKEALVNINKIIGIDSLTIASTAYKNWLKFTKKYWLDKKISYWDNKSYHKWYQGGFCYLNPKYKNIDLKQKIYVKDVNSLYPFVMKDKFLVAPTKEKCELMDCNHMKLFKIKIKYAKIKKGYIPFINNKGFFNKGEVLSEFENKVFYWTEIDLRLFKWYYDYEVDGNYIIEKHCFNPIKGWFDDYIDFWYNLKQNSAKDSWEYLFSKLMLNSLYGKYGTKPNKPKKVLSKEKPHEKNFKKYGNYYEYTEILSDEEYLTEFIENNIPLKIKFNPMAIFITARAREYLITYIQKNKDIFIYCDTDSIHSLAEIDVDGKTDDKKIGDWKAEGSKFDDGIYYLRGKYLNKKQYILQEKDELQVKLCGFNSNKKHLVNFENFNYGHIFENCKLLPMKVDGGIVLVNTEFKVREKR